MMNHLGLQAILLMLMLSAPPVVRGADCSESATTKLARLALWDIPKQVRADAIDKVVSGIDDFGLWSNVEYLAVDFPKDAKPEENIAGADGGDGGKAAPDDVGRLVVPKDAKARIDRELKDLRAKIDKVHPDKVKYPLAAIWDESAAVRYRAIYELVPGKSEPHELALLVALDDDVRWLRYAAAVRLGYAGLHAEQVAPILVEALGGDNTLIAVWGSRPNPHSSVALWGTRRANSALSKLGASALPHLASSVDSPNGLLRRNGCQVLRTMTSTVKDRKHFQEPLAALDAAISGNRYPESRPMYVAVRMKIDGEVDRAEKLLRDDSRSDDLAVRIAAFRQIKHFGPAAVRFLPLLIETLDDAEPQLALAAIRALGRLRDRDLDIDVSAAVPEIARQVEKQKGVYWLRDNLLRFLLEGDNAEHCPVGPIVGALSDSVPSNRSLAAVVLGRMGPRAEPALPALRKLLDDPDKSVRGAAQNAIEATRSLPPKVTQ